MTINAQTGLAFPRGATPTPSHRLLASPLYSSRFEIRAAPPQLAYVPPKLSYWCNDRYGTCVTTEEAFAKACYVPEIFIPDSVVEAWARKNGVLNGASLDEVLDWMVNGGFVVSSQRYNDGRKLLVNYSDQEALKSAIAQGPVKIAIAADALPSGAGNYSGWYAVGNRVYRNTDHCVSICGFGPASWLYQQLGVALPAGLAANPTQPGYLLFTWSTIGFVNHAWLMGTCAEAWVRDPTTIGVPPLTPEPPLPPVPPNPPDPPQPPDPPVPPTPPSKIVITGTGKDPLVGSASGVFVATCGQVTTTFKIASAGGRNIKLVEKVGETEQEPRPKPNRKKSKRT